MSGRKISEVTSSIECTETAIKELQSSQLEASSIMEELGSLGIDPSPLISAFASIEERWHSVTSCMTKLKLQIATRHAARETHRFDSEYKEAKEIESRFSKVLHEMRIFLIEIKRRRTEARCKHQAQADALGKSIKDLESEINNRETFGLFQSSKLNGQFTDASEFAEMIGLGPTHLEDVKNLIALARQAVQIKDFDKAKILLNQADQLWHSRKTALQQLQDLAASDASTARTIADFFADKGLAPSLELVNGHFRLLIRAYDDANAEALYTANFRPYIDRGSQTEHIVWDTPEGSGCINIVSDLNTYMRARGFLHAFTSRSPSGNQTSVASKRSVHNSKAVDRRRG